MKVNFVQYCCAFLLLGVPVFGIENNVCAGLITACNLTSQFEKDELDWSVAKNAIKISNIRVAARKNKSNGMMRNRPSGSKPKTIKHGVSAALNQHPISESIQSREWPKTTEVLAFAEHSITHHNPKLPSNIPIPSEEVPAHPHAGLGMNGSGANTGASSQPVAGILFVPALVGPVLAIRLFSKEIPIPKEELAWRFFRPPRRKCHYG